MCKVFQFLEKILANQKKLANAKERFEVLRKKRYLGCKKKSKLFECLLSSNLTFSNQFLVFEKKFVTLSNMDRVKIKMMKLMIISDEMNLLKLYFSNSYTFAT